MKDIVQSMSAHNSSNDLFLKIRVKKIAKCHDRNDKSLDESDFVVEVMIRSNVESIK